MNPALEIRLDIIRYNVKKLKDLLNARDVELLAVTKVMLGNPVFARALVDEGVKWLGDSRIQNIERMRNEGITAKIEQIRAPQLSEIRDTVKFSDAALISELDSVKYISKTAESLNRKYGIVVMVEMGDLREGVMPGDLLPFLKEVRNYPNIDFLGIGMNLGCYGAIMPTKEKLSELVQIKDSITDKGIDVQTVSVGGTNTLLVLENERIKGVNQLRVGEAIVSGRDTERGRLIPYLKRDAFLLKAEIIEIKEKPSIPYGEIGRNAFGVLPTFKDEGIRKRAILAIGAQDIDTDSLIPVDDKIKILGTSSDHMIVDITDSDNSYKIGSEIEFSMLYLSLLRAMNSEYVSKRFVEGISN